MFRAHEKGHVNINFLSSYYLINRLTRCSPSKHPSGGSDQGRNKSSGGLELILEGAHSRGEERKSEHPRVNAKAISARGCAQAHLVPPEGNFQDIEHFHVKN